MDFFNLSKNSKLASVDEEQLKIIAGIIKKYSSDLVRIKKQSDTIWEQCSESLDDDISYNLKIVKEINDKKFKNSIEELNNSANKMETIANIWQDTEIEIKTSSKKLEELFESISKSMKSAIESSKNNN